MKRFVLVILIISAPLFFLAHQSISAPNRDGIANTRHNLLVSYGVTMPVLVGTLYNNYGEVCVYCHTPHGGQNSNAPLWNRTMPSGSYTPYSSTTIDTNVGQPDGVSLACLSCHDGTIAVDAINNAPGSGAAWGGPVAGQHYALAQTNADGTVITQPTTGTGSCLQCHAVLPQDFSPMALSQNLSNQHPISMNYPTLSQDRGFNQSLTNNGSIAWFEEAGGIAGRPDDNELKLYGDGAGGYKVQCATCHNPHGTRIPGSTDGTDNNLYPTFLRKSNANSGVCLTCHIK